MTSERNVGNFALVIKVIVMISTLGEWKNRSIDRNMAVTDYKAGLLKFITGYDPVKGLNPRVTFDSLI